MTVPQDESYIGTWLPQPHHVLPSVYLLEMYFDESRRIKYIRHVLHVAGLHIVVLNRFE
jgi:hypothetical protein